MDRKDFIHKLRSGRMSRREFAATLAGVGLATVMMRPRHAMAAAADLQVFTWAGYDIPELHQAYIQKHGGSPTFSLLASAEEAFQKLRAGYVVDISHPCVENIATWTKAGLIKPLDTAKLEYWNDLFPELFSLPGAVTDGQHFFLPFDWGNGSLLYRTDKVQIEEESWSLAFDERYKGQIAMYNSKPAVTVAALVLGIDPFNFGDEEGEKIRALMRKQRELVRFYWDSPAQYQQAMAAGEVSIAYAWNDGLKELEKQGIPVKYMVPKEGILNWTCGLVHMANSPAPDDLVYDFLNAMTAPETGKYMIEQYNYGHANRKAFDISDKAQLESLAFTEPQKLFQTGVFETEVTAEMEQRRNKILEDVRLGL